MNIYVRIFVLAGCVALLTATGAFAGAGHMDFEVGQSAGKLVVLGVPADEILLEPGTGLYEGLFVADEPGWTSLSAARPPDVLPLPPGHAVALKRLGFSPGLAMYEPFSALEILSFDGDSFNFPTDGAGDFHEDLVYAESGPIGATGLGRFQLVDDAGLLAPSDPFELSFRVVPEPGSTALLLLVARRITRRRAPSRAPARPSP